MSFWGPFWAHSPLTTVHYHPSVTIRATFTGACLMLCMLLRAALNQFTKALDKNQAETLYKLLLKYQPEDKPQKKERLMKEAETRAAGKVSPHSSLHLSCSPKKCIFEHFANLHFAILHFAANKMQNFLSLLPPNSLCHARFAILTYVVCRRCWCNTAEFCHVCVAVVIVRLASGIWQQHTTMCCVLCTN